MWWWNCFNIVLTKQFQQSCRLKINTCIWNFELPTVYYTLPSSCLNKSILCILINVHSLCIVSNFTTFQFLWTKLTISNEITIYNFMGNFYFGTILIQINFWENWNCFSLHSERRIKYTSQRSLSFTGEKRKTGIL